MPLYDHQCRECGERWETLASRASDPAPSCPGCGGRQVSRLISTFAVTSAVSRARRSSSGRSEQGPADSPTTGPCVNCTCESGREL